MNPILIQAVGYIALLFVLVSFQQKERLRILLTMMVGLILYVLHYALLGAWTGSLLNLIEAAMVFVAYQKEHSPWAQQRFWPFVFMALFITAGLATATSWISLLPIFAQILGTIAVWQPKPRAIRFIMLAPRPLWFTYNLFVGSQAGMVGEVILLASVLSAIFRLDLRKQSRRKRAA